VTSDTSSSSSAGSTVVPRGSGLTGGGSSPNGRIDNGIGRDRNLRPVVGQAVARPPLDLTGYPAYVSHYNPWYISASYGYGYGYNNYGYGYGYGCGGWCSPYWGWNPYWYYNPFAYGYGYGSPYGYGAYNNGYNNQYGYSSSNAYTDPNTVPAPKREIGSLRLKAKPVNAQVYIDGVLVGSVDDFDGLTDHLELDAGPHQMQIRADGYLPHTKDITVKSGRTLTERVSLKKG
jgi:PEGA domain